MSRKLKIAWLCTFSNAEKRSHLKVWRPAPGGVEYGQWIPNLLAAFEDDAALEVHVISTDNWLARRYQSWTARNVTYHCFRSGVPVLGRLWPAWLPVEHVTGFWLNRRRIRRIVRAIAPDVIHLFGVENPQYGAAALNLLPRHPVLVTIQGFVHRERRYRESVYTRVRCRYERALLQACRAYTGDYESERVVRAHRPDASYRHFYFPVNEALVARTPAAAARPYDLLFAAAPTPQKGYDDFLEIVRVLAADRPELLAAIAGSVGPRPGGREAAARHGLERNVRWLGRFPDQAGLFQVFRQTKVFLAPTYNDAFASTIRECMLLGTPVVAYATGGLPWANRDGGDNIVLVPPGERGAMARAAAGLLDDDAAREARAARARAFAREEFALRPNADVIRGAYRELAGNAGRVSP